MADNRTMAQMLQAPIEGYEDAIVVPPINANNFELKQPLINLVQSNKFTGRQDPHNHLRFFNKVTSTFRHPEVPNTSIKLLLFPFSLDGEARDWLDKEPPRSILTWDDLVLKFINQFFPPSKTTYLRNEITTFYQKPNEIFNEAWECFKGLLPITNAPSSTSSPSNNSFEIQQMAALLKDKMNIRMSRLEKAISEKQSTPATVKAVEEVCVTCGSNHNFNNCPLTRKDFPVFHDNIHQFQQTTAVGNFVQNNQGNCNPILANQMRPPGFNQSNVQNNQGNQNRYQGNNFNSNQNRGGNFNHQNNQGQFFQPPTNQPPVYQIPPYQAPTPQIQGVSKTDFENYVKANDAVLKNVKNQDSAYFEVRNSSKSKTVDEPLSVKINAINTRSGLKLRRTFESSCSHRCFYSSKRTPLTYKTTEGGQRNLANPNLENTAQVPPPEEEDSIFIKIPKPKAKKTVNVEIQDLNSPRPNSYQSKLPYPERMKVRENDKPSAQHSRFLKMFKQLRLEIGFEKMLVVEMPIVTKNVPRNSKDHEGNFFISMCFTHELYRTRALADSELAVECFAPEDNNDEIDAFLAMEVSSNFEEEISDHEPEQNDPQLLCEISTSQSSVIESLPLSPIPDENSEPVQEEIDIFLVPDDLIPPGVENDDSEDEVNELSNLDMSKMMIRQIPRPPLGKPPGSLIHVGKEKLVKSKALIGSLSSNASLDLVKAQREWKFALQVLSEKAQGVTITDCHAGNPCVHICDPRALNHDPMIRKMNDRD
ncbi:reverse transcriptase domain-containing protein [Tanacetum coccineum]